jgi:hypothetical protein
VGGVLRHLHGASTVDYLDNDVERLAIAESFGARAHPANREHRGYDVVVEATSRMYATDATQGRTNDLIASLLTYFDAGYSFRLVLCGVSPSRLRSRAAHVTVNSSPIWRSHGFSRRRIAAVWSGLWNCLSNR